MLDFVANRYALGQNRQRLLFYPLNYEDENKRSLTNFYLKSKLWYNNYTLIQNYV